MVACLFPQILRAEGALMGSMREVEGVPVPLVPVLSHGLWGHGVLRLFTCPFPALGSGDLEIPQAQVPKPKIRVVWRSSYS